MRNLNLEAAIWYFFTAPEFFELAAKECEDTMEWFGNLAIARGVVNYGRNNQVHDAFKKAARNFRRGAEFARLGDYKLVYDAAWSIASDIRGMMEQPFRSWMTEAEYEEFQSKYISNILTYKAEIIHSIGNAESGMRRFLISDPEDFDIRDRDEGFANDEVMSVYEFAIHEKKMPWQLPNPLPHYAINRSISCKTGDEVPWSGVWYPETGLERHSLTFAVKGWRMQPVYEVAKTFEELRKEQNNPWISTNETKAVATTWHPVIPLPQLLQANDGILRIKAGEPCPQTGVWQSMDIKGEKRSFKQGDVMPDLASAYGFTVWQYVRQS